MEDGSLVCMNELVRGMKAGIPIGLGYLSVSFTFGIIAVSYGFTWWQAVIISMTTVELCQYLGHKKLNFFSLPNK